MTAQCGEILIYEGKEYKMACEPFSQYLQKTKIKLALQATNSSLWRGYLGEWEIINNKLYLIKISGIGQIRNLERFRFERLKLRKKFKNGIITTQENGILIKQLKKDCMEDIELSLNSLFKSEEKVFANWYSGLIVCPYGKIIKYIHMGYESIFEHELYFEIINGQIQKYGTRSNKSNLNLFQRIINFFNSKHIMH
jgi:hypothetical protein